MTFPRNVAAFTGVFENVGLPNETFKVSWNYPGPTNFGTKSFAVGSEIFLETPTNINDVPDEHLIASISMSAILAGEVLPGSSEFLASVLDQGNKNFQTIVGDVKLKLPASGQTNPTPVSDLTFGPDGTVFDFTVQRVALTSSFRTFRTDAWSISQYSNRVDLPEASVCCVPGAIHKQFAFKKSQLGVAGSANRQSVIDFVAAQRFWI